MKKSKNKAINQDYRTTYSTVKGVTEHYQIDSEREEIKRV